MRILLAEDDQNISVIALMALEQLGQHEVVHVADGESALEQALNGEWDLILLDQMMPKMNGLTVCNEYKSRSDKNVPIIFLSAKSHELDIKQFTLVGQGFIAKPFDPTQLCQQIEDILNENIMSDAV